jgi:hypothetical protein
VRRGGAPRAKRTISMDVLCDSRYWCNCEPGGRGSK